MRLKCIEDMLVPVKGHPDDSVYVLEGEVVPAREMVEHFTFEGEGFVADIVDSVFRAVGDDHE